MKKIALFTAFLAIIGAAIPARAEVIYDHYLPVTGHLVKIATDHDPATHEDEAVYYIDQDLCRRPFPNRRVYESWYRDFSGVREISGEEMAMIRLAAPILYRPGTRLIKIPSIPKVYAVEPGGRLRWIETEAVAKALYGDDWAQRVDDVSEALFVNYAESTPLTAPVWPSGSYVRRISDDSLFMIEGLAKRHVTPAAAEALRINESDVIRTGSDLSDYVDFASYDPADKKLTDTSEVSHIDVSAPPVFDFPATVEPLRADEDRALAAFRLTSGTPVIIKQMRVRLEGPLWISAAPALSDLRFVDIFGENLFGTKQLATPGAVQETITWSGAYTMPADSVSVIELRARVGAVPAGAEFTVAIERAGLKLAHGGNDQALPDFYPRQEFPQSTLEVE